MIGIYKLVFPELPDWPYVGQSLDINQRYYNHLTSLKRGDGNYKLQDAYDQGGDPELEILEECTADQLHEREMYWVEKLDSINNGLNLTTGGDSSGSGYTHARSKFSREQLLEVWKLLQNPSNTYQNISDLTGVSSNQVAWITKGKTHKWLMEEFPEQWIFIQGINRRIHSTYENATVTLVSPDRKEYDTEGLSGAAFAKKIGESSAFGTGINGVMQGKSRQHKGWTLKGQELKIYTLLSPIGTEHVVTESKTGDFCKTYGMSRPNLVQVFKGKSSLGWSLLQVV